ncbi:MAG TPA: FTR1 family protein [Bellilinea sp.]
MLSSLLLALREGLEAALIVGILLGAIQKMKAPHLRKWIWSGVAAAIALSIAAAFGLNVIGAKFEGRGEQIFEGIMMTLAALLLTWMIFWMYRQSRYLRQNLEAGVNRAAAKNNSGSALFLLAFTAVGREGIELALFLIAARVASEPLSALLGALAGLSLAVFLGYLLFATTFKLNLQRFFQVTNILLLLFAAGLLAHGVHEFNEAGVIPAVIEHVYDINSVLPEKSIGGLLLTALFGYNGNPSLTEMLTYIIFLTGLGIVTLPKTSSATVPASQSQ